MLTSISIIAFLQQNRKIEIKTCKLLITGKKYVQNAGIGCDKNTEGALSDEYGNNPKAIDKDLKVGDTFNMEHVNTAITEANESSTTSSVAKILDMKVLYNLVINKSSNIYDGSTLDINSIFISKPHGTKTFDKLKEEGITTYNFSQKGLELMESAKNKSADSESYWYCWVSESKTNKNNVALINYEMNGKKIPALLAEYTRTGKAKCEKRNLSTETEDKVLKTIELENGESSWKSISSRMVKSDYLVSCAGETLFSQATTKVNGKVVSASASKTTAPTR